MKFLKTFAIFSVIVPFSYGQSVISANVTHTAVYKLDASDIVGVQPVGHWNNIGIDAAGVAVSGDKVNLSHAIDSNGNSTDVTLTIEGAPYGYVNNTTVTEDPNTKMMVSARGSSHNGTRRVIQATNVPYDSYDVYVYFGGVTSSGSTPYTISLKLQEPDGFGGWQDVTPANEVVYLRDTNRSWDGTYDESTALTVETAEDGREYVVFRNVTLDDFRIRTAAGVGRRAGLSGFQIVGKAAPSNGTLVIISSLPAWLVLSVFSLVVMDKLKKKYGLQLKPSTTFYKFELK